LVRWVAVLETVLLVNCILPRTYGKVLNLKIPFLGERGKGGVGAERTGKSQVRICKKALREMALSLGVCV
jgi:hypothetical protein